MAQAAVLLGSTDNYTSWPSDGCTLAEARERVADRASWREWKDASDQQSRLGPRLSFWQRDHIEDVHDDMDFRNRLRRRVADCEEALNSSLRAALRSGALVAYGRPGGLSDMPVLIPKDVWPALTTINTDESAAGEHRSGGTAYFAVNVFPVVLAPDRVQLLAGRSLAEVFRKFVLEDPEVATFAREGIKLAPEFEAIFVKGRCFVHGIPEWPVDPDRWETIGYVHPDPHKQSVFDDARNPSPLEIVISAEALLQRYRALMNMLRRCELEVYGIGEKSGQVERIPGSIWAHEDFHLNAQGDVFQNNPECENPPLDRFNRRWAAIEFRAPDATLAVAPVFHVKPPMHDELRSATDQGDILVSVRQRSKARMSPKADAVAAALKKVRISQRPIGMSNKAIAAKIAAHMPGPQMSPEALAKAVARHFKGIS